MLAFAVILLIVAAFVIVFGLILYGNGVGAVPDEVGRHPAATRQGLARISWGDLFARMKTCISGMTDENRAQKLTATGAFCVLLGLVLVLLAVLAFVAAFA
jgi:hypothetical protein